VETGGLGRGALDRTVCVNDDGGFVRVELDGRCGSDRAALDVGMTSAQDQKPSGGDPSSIRIKTARQVPPDAAQSERREGGREGGREERAVKGRGTECEGAVVFSGC